ncbi:extensin family protein [Paracoccus cavernae]|uniref:Extensin family protein n=1 Tax=Paracoccus cavernae TaxID=1571207 RepID=A0ABT8DBJ1_9RHOB|nr:extensin family protein [Paracoccus cavernae]
MTQPAPAQGQEAPAIAPQSSKPPPPKPAAPETAPKAASEAASEAAPESALPEAAKPEAQAETGAAPPLPVPRPKPMRPLPDGLRGSDLGHSACLLTLYLMGARYSEEPAITEENPDCGIARPISVSQILPGVTLDGDPVMRCETARQLAFWLNGTVLPATRFLDGAPRLAAIAPGSTYQCRGVIGTQSSANVSEHALGMLSTSPPSPSTTAKATRSRRVRTTAIWPRPFWPRSGGACLYFTTVLGPGTNAAHDNHLHLDIKARKGGFRICQ